MNDRKEWTKKDSLAAATDSLIGLCLRNARKKKKYTQKKLSKAMGITQSAYSAYETGSHRCSVSTLLKISKILDMPIDEIVDNTLLEIMDLQQSKDLLNNAELEDLDNLVDAYEFQNDQKQEWAQIGKDIAINFNAQGQKLIKDYINLMRQNPVMTN